MTNGNINLYNQLHFTWLSLPNAQCPHLTTTHGPTQQLVGVTSGHCYNQPLQPVLSSSWQHNTDNDGHSPSPAPPPHPPAPGGHSWGPRRSHSPTIHPWSWSWCQEWNVINNIGHIFPTNTCRFMNHDTLLWPHDRRLIQRLSSAVAGQCKPWVLSISCLWVPGPASQWQWRRHSHRSNTVWFGVTDRLKNTQQTGWSRVHL